MWSLLRLVVPSPQVVFAHYSGVLSRDCHPKLIKKLGVQWNPFVHVVTTPGNDR